jgi:MoxR-like ATPase
LPFYETTEATLEQSIEALIVDPALRREYAERGRRHVTTVHSPQAVIQRTIELYRAA